ncbi:MAG TPA: hypothetical protein VEU11_12475 [Terriglobales bacterium]|nr:hypothetical protein [Terriglobales bacterium]
MATSSAFFSKTHRTWILVCTALALLSALAVWRTSEKAAKMESAVSAVGQDRFQSLKPGELTKVVMEVLDSSPESVKGRLLERQTETVYARSETLAEAAIDTHTSFVMGKASDIHPGAILHVSGAVTPTRSIQARQIVILTGYVHVR